MSEPRWRVGRTLGRTLYRDGACMGMVDSPEVAASIVEAMNGLTQVGPAAVAAADVLAAPCPNDRCRAAAGSMCFQGNGVICMVRLRGALPGPLQEEALRCVACGGPVKSWDGPEGEHPSLADMETRDASCCENPEAGWYCCMKFGEMRGPDRNTDTGRALAAHIRPGAPASAATVPDCLKPRTPEDLAALPRLRPEDIEAAHQRGIRDRNAALGLPMPPEPRRPEPPNSREPPVIRPLDKAGEWARMSGVDSREPVPPPVGICDACDASDVELVEMRGRGIAGVMVCKGTCGGTRASSEPQR